MESPSGFSTTELQCSESQTDVPNVVMYVIRRGSNMPIIDHVLSTAEFVAEISTTRW